MELIRSIGKSPVLLKKEIPGFIANRLQIALAREAFHLLNEGVASAEEIDRVMTSGAGFRWAFLQNFYSFIFYIRKPNHYTIKNGE